MTHKSKILFPIILSMMFTSCSSIENFGKRSIQYTLDGTNFQNLYYYNLDDLHKASIKNFEKKYHYFQGLYTEPNGKGTKFTNSYGNVLTSVTLDNVSKLYAYYVPYQYTVKIDTTGTTLVLEQDTFVINYGEKLPELPLVEPSTNYDFSHYSIKEDGIKISDGTEYLKGFETMNDLAYDCENDKSIFTFVPNFKRQQISMTFSYPKDGKNVITETIYVDKLQDLYKCAPTYVDENGYEHHFKWFKEDGKNEMTISKEGSTAYAKELLVKRHYSDNGDSPYIVEKYNINNISESTIDFNSYYISKDDKTYHFNVNSSINISPYTNKVIINATAPHNFTLHDISFNVEKRNTDIELEFNSENDMTYNFISQLGNNLIYAYQMNDNAKLILTSNCHTQLYGHDGENGTDGKDNSNILLFGDDPDIAVEHGNYGGNAKETIVCENLRLNIAEGKSLVISGGNGGNGGHGGNGAKSNRNEYKTAIDGGNGGNGGQGGVAIWGLERLTLDNKGTLNITAGNGGNGGNGGKGGEGIGNVFTKNDSGGDGGNGGDGGPAGRLFSVTDLNKIQMEIINNGNIAFVAGSGGNGGNGGKGGYANYTNIITDEGYSGDGGNAGRGGQSSFITVHPHYLQDTAFFLGSNNSVPGTPGAGGDNTNNKGKGYPGDNASYYTGGIYFNDIKLVSAN